MSAAQSARAAAGVLGAAMAQGCRTPAELADAEQSAGILFDPERAQAIDRAAREQERDQLAAEIKAVIERSQRMPVDTAEATATRGARILGLRAALRLVQLRRARPLPDEPITYEITAAAERVAELEQGDADELARPCPRPGCGATDREVADADVYGWIRVRVCGIDGPPQWWCSPRCAQRSITTAQQQLAEADARSGGEG